MTQRSRLDNLTQSLVAWWDERLIWLGLNVPPAGQSERRQRIETLYTKLAEQFPMVAEISVQELMQLQREQSVVLVDVRSPKEQAVSMLPGAIPQATFEQERDRLPDMPIVAYCTIGYRSGLFAQRLQQQGVPVRNLRGSILAWTHAGGNLMDASGQPTRKLHVYSKRWDLIASGYEAVW
jgi:sodium/bile acid cotransporter 7